MLCHGKYTDSETSLDQAVARSGRANAIRVDGNKYSANVVPVWQKLSGADMEKLSNTGLLNLPLSAIESHPVLR